MTQLHEDRNAAVPLHNTPAPINLSADAINTIAIQYNVPGALNIKKKLIYLIQVHWGPLKIWLHAAEFFLRSSAGQEFPHVLWNHVQKARHLPSSSVKSNPAHF